MNPLSTIFLLCRLIQVYFKFMVIIISIAFLSNLYKQAIIFEDGHTVLNPEKEALKSQLEDIS